MRPGRWETRSFTGNSAAGSSAKSRGLIFTRPGHPSSCRSRCVPEEVIAALAAEAPLWIVSNTNKAHFDCIAGRFGFLRFFQGWILSHEVGAAKPDRRIFELALGRAGVAAHEALFVDDSLENVEAALAIGIDAFQFVGLPEFRQELAARGLLPG